VEQRSKTIGVILCLMAMAFFAGWPFWKWVYLRSATASVQERTRAIVDTNEQLKPAWDVAMRDGVLTFPEAKVIVEAAGESLDAEK
jgi:hypothetical protein